MLVKYKQYCTDAVDLIHTGSTAMTSVTTRQIPDQAIPFRHFAKYIDMKIIIFSNFIMSCKIFCIFAGLKPYKHGTILCIFANNASSEIIDCKAYKYDSGSKGHLALTHFPLQNFECFCKTDNPLNMYPFRSNSPVSYNFFWVQPLARHYNDM